MKTVLVTGGAGFVGSSLSIALRENDPDLDVVALDNLRRRGSELNLPRLQKAGVKFLHGDVRNPEDIEAAGHFDAMIECSAEPSVSAGYDESPAYVVNTNLIGTANCLEAVRKHGAGIVFLSTSRVYPIKTLGAASYSDEGDRFVLSESQPMAGLSDKGVSETFPLEGSRSLYGATKLCSELLLAEYLSMFELNGVVNRCGVIAGPWQMGKVDQGFVALWTARHHYKRDLAYIGFGGRGHQVRDVLHIGDLGRLVLYELENLEALSGQTFNVGGGAENAVSLAELTALCREITGNTVAIREEPDTRAADIPIYITDNSRVTKSTGWRPEKSLRDTVEDTAAWIRSHEDALRPILG